MTGPSQLKTPAQTAARQACDRCGGRSVYRRQQRSLTVTTTVGEHLCAGCFTGYVEQRIDDAIRTYEMVRPGDRVLACVSGEKDSTVMFHLLHQWLRRTETSISLTMLCVDEGIGEYRTRCVELARQHADARDVPYVIRSYENVFSARLDTIRAQRPEGGPRICVFCCSLRGRIVREVAAELDCNVVATGGNLNDGAEFAMMGLLRGKIDEHGLPCFVPSGGEVRFIAPMYALTGLEVRLYSMLNDIAIQSEDCPFCAEHLRDDVRDSLHLLEDRNPGALAAIFAGYQRLVAAQSGPGQRGSAAAVDGTVGRGSP